MTWIDFGADVTSSIGDWFLSHIVPRTTQQEFSVAQLEMLKELIKAGLIGMSRVVAMKFDELEKRLEKLEIACDCSEAATPSVAAASSVDLSFNMLESNSYVGSGAATSLAAASSNSRTKARRSRRKRMATNMKDTKEDSLQLQVLQGNSDPHFLGDEMWLDPQMPVVKKAANLTLRDVIATHGMPLERPTACHVVDFACNIERAALRWPAGRRKRSALQSKNDFEDMGPPSLDVNLIAAEGPSLASDVNVACMWCSCSDGARCCQVCGRRLCTECRTHHKCSLNDMEVLPIAMTVANHFLLF